jgi:hypothetical protein
MNRYVAAASRLTVVSRCACLIGVVALVFAIASPVAYADRGAIGVQAVLFAAAVSLAGALVAILLASVYQGTPAAVAWILAGDGIAMAVPLLAGVVVTRRGGALADAGVFNWIVLFFLVALTTKTLLIAPLAQQARRSAVNGRVGDGHAGDGATTDRVQGDRVAAAAELGAKITKVGT